MPHVIANQSRGPRLYPAVLLADATYLIAAMSEHPRRCVAMDGYALRRPDRWQGEAETIAREPCWVASWTRV